MSNSNGIRLSCPQCTTQFTWKEKYSGRKASCTGCGSRLRLPASADGDVVLLLPREAPVEPTFPAAQAESPSDESAWQESMPGDLDQESPAAPDTYRLAIDGPNEPEPSESDDGEPDADPKAQRPQIPAGVTIELREGAAHGGQIIRLERMIRLWKEKQSRMTGVVGVLAAIAVIVPGMAALAWFSWNVMEVPINEAEWRWFPMSVIILLGFGAYFVAQQSSHDALNRRRRKKKIGRPEMVTLRFTFAFTIVRLIVPPILLMTFLSKSLCVKRLSADGLGTRTGRLYPWSSLGGVSVCTYKYMGMQKAVVRFEFESDMLTVNTNWYRRPQQIMAFILPMLQDSRESQAVIPESYSV